MQVKALMLAQRALLYAGDELSMARLRLRVQLEGEQVQGREQTFVLHPAEVPVRNKARPAVWACSELSHPALTAPSCCCIFLASA